MDQPASSVTIIMGVSGCGKSTFAEALAASSGARFVEGDELHSAANIARMRAGQPLTDADRWPWLDRIAAAVNAALAEGSVVATCSALRLAYRDRLRTGIVAPVRFVLLDVPVDESASPAQQTHQRCKQCKECIRRREQDGGKGALHRATTDVVPEEGLEPPTRALRMRCSTS